MSITYAEIVAAENAAKEASSHLADLRRSYAAQECPMVVGDTAEIPWRAHKGKKMLVESISPGKYSWEGAWRVCGRVFKADGELGERRGEITQEQWEKKL